MQGDVKCAQIDPELREVAPGHWAACHHVEGFEKAPVTKPDLDHRRTVTATATAEVSL
jgi:hypothetical protein